MKNLKRCEAKKFENYTDYKKLLRDIPVGVILRQEIDTDNDWVFPIPGDLFGMSERTVYLEMSKTDMCYVLLKYKEHFHELEGRKEKLKRELELLEREKS